MYIRFLYIAVFVNHLPFFPYRCFLVFFFERKTFWSNGGSLMRFSFFLFKVESMIAISSVRLSPALIQKCDFQVKKKSFLLRPAKRNELPSLSWESFRDVVSDSDGRLRLFNVLFSKTKSSVSIVICWNGVNFRRADTEWRGIRYDFLLFNHYIPRRLLETFSLVSTMISLSKSV